VVGEQLQRIAGDRQRHPKGVGDVGDDQVGGLLRPCGAGADERHEHRPVAVAALAGGGGRRRQPGLADAAGADQGHQPAGGVVEQLVQAGQLLFPADQRGEWPGQVGRGRRDLGHRRRSGVGLRRARFLQVGPPGGRQWPVAQLGEPAGAGDLLAQGDGGRRRLDPQLLLQHIPAGLVLGQGGAALAAAGQEPHERTVGLLLERFQLQHAAGDLDSGGPVASVAGQLDRAVHDGEHVGPDRRAPPDQPLIEQRGARDLDAF
jgi:hypothetical protein